MEVLSELGRTLARLRSIRGLSLRACADRLGLEAHHLEQAERGQATLEVVAALAAFHGVDFAGLLDGGVVPVDDSAGATVFLFHGAYQDFSSADLATLSDALCYGRELTARGAKTGALTRRLSFVPIAPAGPRPADAAQQGYKLARRVRKALKLIGDPLPDARELLEEGLGVAVVVRHLQSRGLQAAAIIDVRRAAAAAVLAADDPDRSRNPALTRVQLAHELCHILFDPAAPGTVRLALDGSDSDRVGSRTAPGINALLEARAKGFAAELLLPRTGLEALLGPPRQVGELSCATTLVALARDHFGTPWEIATYHLKNLGFVDAPLVSDLLADRPKAASSTPTELPAPGAPPIALDGSTALIDAPALSPDDSASASEPPPFVTAALAQLEPAFDRISAAVVDAAHADIAEGRVIEATDRLVDHLDDLLRTGEFDVAARLLDALDPAVLTLEVVGGVLMVTADASEHLGDARRSFVGRAMAALAGWGLEPVALARIEARFG